MEHKDDEKKISSNKLTLRFVISLIFQFPLTQYSAHPLLLRRILRRKNQVGLLSNQLSWALGQQVNAGRSNYQNNSILIFHIFQCFLFFSVFYVSKNLSNSFFNFYHFLYLISVIAVSYLGYWAKKEIKSLWNAFRILTIWHLWLFRKYAWNIFLHYAI